MQCIESRGGEFKLYVPCKRKPVKLFEDCIRREWGSGARLVFLEVLRGERWFSGGGVSKEAISGNHLDVHVWLTDNWTHGAAYQCHTPGARESRIAASSLK